MEIHRGKLSLCSEFRKTFSSPTALGAGLPSCHSEAHVLGSTAFAFEVALASARFSLGSRRRDVGRRPAPRQRIAQNIITVQNLFQGGCVIGETPRCTGLIAVRL